MQDARYKILVWLPSPLGDAVLCTPALRAIRQHFRSSKIWFLARPAVCQLLSPNSFNDMWLTLKNGSPFQMAKILKKHQFTHAILFKNSFASGLASFLARIPSRIGYARDCRGFMLTDKLYPPSLSNGRFKPISMIDYYLAIACWLGADTTNRNLELLIEQKHQEQLKAKLPQLVNSVKPIVIIVPAGAYGPSKYWPADRFAQVADWLFTNYNATIIISVASNRIEQAIAEEICSLSKYNHKHKLINLAEQPLNLGQLKALFACADLVISNDTGPRHIAIALKRKVVTLFGPNDPAWTETDYKDEIKIIGDAPCAPCEKPVCKKNEHLCMQAITVEMVCNAAKKLLDS